MKQQQIIQKMLQQKANKATHVILFGKNVNIETGHNLKQLNRDVEILQQNEYPFIQIYGYLLTSLLFRLRQLIKYYQYTNNKPLI